MHKHDYNKKAQISSGHGSIRYIIVLQKACTEEELFQGNEGCSPGLAIRPATLLLCGKSCCTGGIQEAVIPNMLFRKKAHTYQTAEVAKQTVQTTAHKHKNNKKTQRS